MRPRGLQAAAGLWGAVVLAAGCGRHNAASSFQGPAWKLSGPSPVEHIAGAFDPGDPDKRREGIVALSERSWGLKEPYLRGYAALLRSDASPVVRSAAVRALGKAREPSYLPDVAAALEDESADVRLDAAVALNTLVGEAAIGPLVRGAQGDGSDDVRAACAWALRHYPRPEVLLALRGSLGDPAYVVRYEARRAMESLAGRDFGPEPDDWAQVEVLAAQ